MDAELDAMSLRDVNETEDRIVSQWREISADEKHQLRDRVDEILRPLGFETRLLVINRANSIALYFLCMTLSAVMSLRDQWRSQQLRNIVQKLFHFLSGSTGIVWVKRLTWPLTDYERCLEFFNCKQGNRRFSNKLIIFFWHSLVFLNYYVVHLNYAETILCRFTFLVGVSEMTGGIVTFKLLTCFYTVLFAVFKPLVYICLLT